MHSHTEHSKGFSVVHCFDVLETPCLHMGERLNSCGGWVPNVVPSRYGYAPSVAMVHIYILSYGNMHQPIRASRTLVAKELEMPCAGTQNVVISLYSPEKAPRRLVLLNGI